MSKLGSAFRAFTAYKIDCNRIAMIRADLHGTQRAHWEEEQQLVRHLSQDPTGSQWSKHGFTEATPEGDLFHDLDGKGYLCAVEFRDRILPGKVIQEEVAKRAADIHERDGRKPGKKALGELRDEVEQELLPKSHIRRSVVHILFTDQRVLVFTASAKKCDTIISFLVHFFNDQGYPINVSLVLPEKDPIGFMTRLALEGSVDVPGHTLYPGSPMVLKDDSRAVRIKDTNTQREEYTALIRKSGYQVNEMAVGLFDSHGTQDEVMSFRMTHSFTFKQVALSDTLLTADLADGGFHAVAWLVATEYTAMLDRILEAMSDEDSL